jgi:LPXTG-site transpeptidase (sortase) family protein
MKEKSFFYDILEFLRNTIGYFLIIFPIILIVFDGRALLAQINWQIDNWFSNTNQNRINLSSSEVDYLISQAPQTEQNEARVIIPKINVNAPIVFPQTIDNDELLSYLEKGVIHYRDSAEIGKPGTAIILGHSSAYPWYNGNYGSVFALLEKLEIGDEFVVSYQNKKYYYRVSEKDIVVPLDFKVEEKDNKSHLILMSCWPVRTNRLRMVINSDLIRVED